MIKLGIDMARKTFKKNIGGPFGCVITDKFNNVIAVTSNRVICDNDPTAHAEINAIRKASKKLGTYDLSGCKIYTTGYPCPMCLSAIIWANVKEVYYGTTLEEAEEIGFRDDFIYDYLNGKNKSILTLKQIEHDKCLELFKEYDKEKRKIY